MDLYEEALRNWESREIPRQTLKSKINASVLLIILAAGSQSLITNIAGKVIAIIWLLIMAAMWIHGFKTRSIKDVFISAIDFYFIRSDDGLSNYSAQEIDKNTLRIVNLDDNPDIPLYTIDTQLPLAEQFRVLKSHGIDLFKFINEPEKEWDDDD